MVFQIISWADDLLAAVLLIAFTYVRYESVLAPVAAFVFYAIIYAFFTRELALILLTSALLSEYIVYDRILRSSGEQTKVYASVALTIILCAFGIATYTGVIEPYQAALIGIVMYIVQARFRSGSTIKLERAVKKNENE